MTMAFALAKASFLCGIGAGFATQNRTRLVGESRKTRFERFIFQTFSFIEEHRALMKRHGVLIISCQLSYSFSLVSYLLAENNSTCKRDHSNERNKNDYSVGGVGILGSFGSISKVHRLRGEYLENG